MKPRLIARTLLLAALLVGTMAAAQSMYKWVDENGRVTYSDKPATGNVKSQEVVSIVGSVNSGAANQVAGQDAQFRKRRDEAAKRQADAAKKQQSDAIRQDSCGRARGELRALRENVLITRMTESGERVALDDVARETEGKRIEAFIEESCSQSSG